MSILYATVAETGPLKYKLNNPPKLTKILNSLTNKWTNNDLFPPRGEEFDNYIAEKHINKDVKMPTVTKKKKFNV